jgi:hypothetical protein
VALKVFLSCGICGSQSSIHLSSMNKDINMFELPIVLDLNNLKITLYVIMLNIAVNEWGVRG